MAKRKASKRRPAQKKAVKTKTARKKTAPTKSPRKKSTRSKPGTTVTEATPSVPDNPLRPKAGEVIVRMYRQGLGDCFLLAFGTDNLEPTYVLIDCGVHVRQTNGRLRLEQVMHNIVQVTGGHLDVVVATHEHADHLSGFVQKGSPFLLDEDQPGSIAIDQAWFAWTEKVGDKQADELRKKRGTARAKIEQAIKKAKENANQQSLAMRLETIMSFETPDAEGFDEDQRKLAMKSIEAIAAKDGEKRLAYDLRFNSFTKKGNIAASKKSRQPSGNEMALFLLAMKASAVHCEPGQRLKLPKIKNVRAFAFGPPRDDKLLKKDSPTKVRGGHDHEFHETYIVGSSTSMAFALSPALDNGVPASPFAELEQVPPDLQHPFAYSYRRKLRRHIKSSPRTDNDRAEKQLYNLTPQSTQTFFKDHYDTVEEWRQIESDWLGSAETLALNLDGDTNNSSLVLAFELGEPGEGSVLLFVGDAQVGNWLSWRDQGYAKRQSRMMSADDLLRRTVLYKVGHHGSHNATVKNDPRNKTIEGGEPFGLELMNDIIAMIPVDRAAADKNMPRPWRMPQKKLYDRLREKADRRVLRSDHSQKPLSNSAPHDVVPKATRWTDVPGKSGFQWRRSEIEFQIDEEKDSELEEGKKETRGPLYYDVRIPIEDR